MVCQSGFWSVGILESVTHRKANPGKESRVGNYSSHPKPKAQHLAFSPFPKHEKPPTHPLGIFKPTEKPHMK